jgi:hypothetical protein
MGAITEVNEARIGRCNEQYRGKRSVVTRDGTNRSGNMTYLGLLIIGRTEMNLGSRVDGKKTDTMFE